MNLMNFNEPLLGMRDSLCFVRGEWAVFGLEQAYLTRFYKTNAIATPKNWFINVHQVHRMIVIRILLYKLMNLMNFNELTCYLRLFFAMYLKGGLVSGFKFQVSSSHKFIRFIKKNPLRLKPLSPKWLPKVAIWGKRRFGVNENWARPEKGQLDENEAALRRMRVIVWMILALVIGGLCLLCVLIGFGGRYG